ncbi:GyrI-like domain-containing protein [Kitasatospora aureofaciens]|uniref:GyrI-like domain-containing protein n=1 Tax=Kitasatospora aureofaciens TaxID=1894 RepID=UPI001C43A42E|nr:GyrI-like domain-containing protein [Kitasatospora aureofaciens]MBV6702041.1 GyrI-like domain-containing protein [Kitasatospora aureofaciens]
MSTTPKSGPAQGKTDHRKLGGALYGAKAVPHTLDVPEFAFLAVDGSGDPGQSPEFGSAIAALYAASYALKFAVRADTGLDYAVMPLEGLWHSTDPDFDAAALDTYGPGDRAGWEWTLLIRQPVPYTDAQLAAALAKAAAKAGAEEAGRIRREVFTEGPCVQVLHKGPYETEPRSVKLLHDYLEAEGLKEAGRHHEIYLSDPTRTAPERRRTILRQPVS